MAERKYSRRPSNKARHLKLTEQQIEAGKSAAGGFTKKTLHGWGVSFPPPKGWKAALLAGRKIPTKASRQRWKNSERAKAGRLRYDIEQDHRALDREAARGI